MDGNAWRSAQGDPNTDNNDWRSQLTPDSRQRIVNKIMETLKKHLSIPEGMGELKKIAVRFEEKIYTAATSQADYLRRISLKMITMGTKSPPNSLPSNLGSGNQNPPDPASMDFTVQIGHSTPINLQEETYKKRKDIMKSIPVIQTAPSSLMEVNFACAICFNTLVEATTTLCGHIFCKECIKCTIAIQKKCPTCRRKLTQKSIHRIYLPSTTI